MIVISRIFDDARAPRLALEYVMYHEMLHLHYPVDHSGARRCVHTPEFKAHEKLFPQFSEAKALLKKLPIEVWLRRAARRYPATASCLRITGSARFT